MPGAEVTAALLRIEAIEAAYQALHRRAARCEPGRSCRRNPRAARRQRCRQVDHAQGGVEPAAGRARAGDGRAHRLRRARHGPHQPGRSRQARPGSGAGGPPLLSHADSGRKPADRRALPRRAALGSRRRPRAGLRDLSQAEGKATHARRPQLRRRTADDGHRPRADVAAPAAGARRAVDGAGAAGGATSSSNCGGSTASRACRSSLPSRTPPLRFSTPTA